MRHTFHYQGRQFIEDSEIAKTHLVLGQRHDALAAEPAPKNMHELSAEERAVRQKYVFQKTRGWFDIRPLAWATSAEDAAALAARFSDPEWINVSVVPLDPSAVIQYA